MFHTERVQPHKLLTTGYTCFNEHYSTKLEDWLTDIESAADLPSESRSRLTKARSGGLTHTLVTETITSNKSWDETKDMLRLKLCNANIHIYTLKFIKIQQWEKESLAAYVHWFKAEVKRCNFTNDVATIRIFIKGLKNAHSLDTHICEKGSQKLSNVISVAEKLNNVQQLTATITPPSTVNMMTNGKDRCLQCQKHGHTARNCPNIRCFECAEYGHIVMDCPHRIPPSGTPAKPHQPKPQKSQHTRSSSRHLHEDRDRQSQSRSQPHFHRHCSSSCHDSFRGCSRSWHRDNCHHYMNSTQHSDSTDRSYSHQPCHDTPHIPHHRSSTHRSPSCHSTDRSHSCSHPSYKSSWWDSYRSHSCSSRSQRKPHHKKNTRLKIEDPHTDYYCSDDHSSNSGEETDH